MKAANAAVPSSRQVTQTRSVHVVMPGGAADPSTPSGGNTYDLRVCRDLPGTGWQVLEHTVDGGWPVPGRAAAERLTRLLARLADGSLVLLDGLVACGVPEIVVPEAGRLRLAVLVHLPLGDETGLAPALAADLDARERETLRAAAVVVATSARAADGLVARHGLDPGRVHVAAPGAEPAPQAAGSLRACGVPGLLCVASVTPRKGQHRLVEALASVAELPWACECVGPLGQDPGYAGRLTELIEEHRLGHRVRLSGPKRGEELKASYAAADLLVLPSSAETYGMVVTEALARGIPVLATDVGGVPEAMGRSPGGAVPGVLVPPDDAAALAAALRRWLTDPAERERAREAARARRPLLHGWETTSQALAAALERLRLEPGRHG